MTKIGRCAFWLLLAALSPVRGERVSGERLADGGWRMRGPDWTADMATDGTLTLQRGEPQSAGASLRFFFRPEAAVPVAIECVKSDDETVISFAITGADGGVPRRLSVDGNGMVTAHETGPDTVLHITADWRHVLLPGFYLEDVRYDRADMSGAPRRIPADRILCGLLGEAEGMLTIGWDHPDAGVWLDSGSGDSGRAGVVVDSPSGRIQADLRVAPGLWHLWRAANNGSEPPDEASRTDLGWRRPFSATWCADVVLDGSDQPTRTRWPFRDARPGRNWWIGTGDHAYPLTWDTDGNAFFEASKTIRADPRGLLIHALEGHADSLMGAVARMDTTEPFRKVLAKTEAYPRPREVPVVGYHWCWGTGLMREHILRSGMQHRDAAYFREWADFMLDSIEATQQRRREYTDFLDGLTVRLTQARAASDPESPLGDFLASMSATAVRLQEEYRQFVQTDGAATPEDAVAEARAQAERFCELVTVPGTDYGLAFESIVSQFNRLAFAQRETTGLFGWRLRRWYQQAATDCGEDAEAVRLARELRRELFDFLAQRGFVSRL